MKEFDKLYTKVTCTRLSSVNVCSVYETWDTPTIKYSLYQSKKTESTLLCALR